MLLVYHGIEDLLPMPKTKLTPEDIAGIFLAHNEGASLGILARLYHVSRTQIWRVLNKKQRTTITSNFSLRSQFGGGKILSNKSNRKISLELIRFLGFK